MGWDLSEVQDTFKIKLPDFDDVYFFCQGVTTQDTQKILRKHTKKVVVGKGRKSTVEEEIDAYQVGLEIWLKTVSDWEGLTKDKKKLECDDENKRWFYERFHSTACQYILDEVARLHEEQSGIASGN